MLPKLLPEDVDAPLGPLTVRVSMASLLVADARKCAEAAEYLEKFARQVADGLESPQGKDVAAVGSAFRASAALREQAVKSINEAKARDAAERLTARKDALGKTPSSISGVMRNAKKIVDQLEAIEKDPAAAFEAVDANDDGTDAENAA